MDEEEAPRWEVAWGGDGGGGYEDMKAGRGRKEAGKELIDSTRVSCV